MTTVALQGWRASLAAITEHPSVRRAIIALILLNSLVLGFDTVPSVVARFGDILSKMDTFILGIFVIELLLRLAAFQWDFFKSGWNWFDLIIVGASLFPNSEVLSVLRVLRLLRLVSMIPSLRVVVEGLLAALPRMGAVSILMAIFMFIGGIIVTKLFGEKAPAQFGDLFISTFSMLQVTTLDGWPDMARAAMKTAPHAWVFFFAYIFVTTFTVMNLFVGVMVSSMEEKVEEHKAAQAKAKADAARAAGEAPEESADQDIVLVMNELRAMRAELRELRGIVEKSA